MPPADLSLLLKARRYLRIKRHRPGEIRLGFSASLLGAVPELQAREGREALTRLPGITDVGVNPFTFTLSVAYDPARIPPTFWEQLVEGDDNAAEAVVAHLDASQPARHA